MFKVWDLVRINSEWSSYDKMVGIIENISLDWNRVMFLNDDYTRVKDAYILPYKDMEMKLETLMVGDTIINKSGDLMSTITHIFDDNILMTMWGDSKPKPNRIVFTKWEFIKNFLSQWRTVDKKIFKFSKEEIFDMAFWTNTVIEWLNDSQLIITAETPLEIGTRVYNKTWEYNRYIFFKSKKYIFMSNSFTDADKKYIDKNWYPDGDISCCTRETIVSNYILSPDDCSYIRKEKAKLRLEKMWVDITTFIS